MNDRDRIEWELIDEAHDCDILCQRLEYWMTEQMQVFRRNDLAGDFFAKIQDAISDQRAENQHQRETAGQTALDTAREAQREAREE